jgi:hypothetical protein
MSKYNTKIEPVVQKTTTLQGGPGLTQRPEAELISILATGMGNNFYEKETEREKRFKEVLGKVAKKNPTFAAKALIYARTVFGQRSVTHFGAVELIPFLQGNELGKRFFSKRDKKAERGGIIWRIDDMAEILAAYIAKNGIKQEDKWTLPNSIKKGFKDALEHADTYELAKYQLKNRGVSLVDIVNLVHPVETPKNGFIYVTEEAYKKAVAGTKFANKEFNKNEKGEVQVPAVRALILGILKQFNTVEDKNTESGKVVAEKVKSGEITKEQAATELNEAKTENYKELIEEKKIGYLALLRNVRNILKTNDMDLLDKACDLLVEKEFIRKSLVWPHQIDLALEVMTLEFNGTQLRKVATALDKAYELSIPNLEHLLPEGRTAIVFDTSGSMDGANRIPIDAKDPKKTINKKPAEKAALIAATLAKGVGGDVYHFASGSEQITGWNPIDSINTLKQKFMSYNGRQGHGTDFGACFKLFERMNKQYDRVLIISDEQDGYGNVESNYKGYCQKFGTPYVYIINVVGYAPTAPIKNGDRVFRLYGYTADIYEKIPRLEMNVNEVIDAINRIEI